mmetsp:Transcript_103813/g.179294  ORF Transcript_103813/g.179294 Transcript_103813/m.179294 type:complete len:507 (-) Transcript_103813:198-1718(-)
MTLCRHIFLFLTVLSGMARAWPWNSKGADSSSAVDNQSAAAPRRIQHVPLQKQYVPVMKNNKTIAYKTAYFGEVFVGTPKNTFTVVFDTGSGHFILPRQSCTTETCAKHRRYDGKASSTSTDIEYDGKVINPASTQRDQVIVSFGTGKVTGEFVKDYVCVGASANDVDCAMLRVVLAIDMTPDPFGLFAFDGVLGLGLNALTLDPKFSFFGEMVAQNPGMHPQFSVFLARHEGGESVISFGGHDPEKADSELAWSPVAMQELGYWQVQIKGVRIGDQVLEECRDGGCRAVLDTGTSLLGVPRMAARALHRMLARQLPAELEGKSDVDCRHVSGHDVEFDLGGHTVNIPAEDYSRPAPFNMSVTVNGTNTSKLFCRSLLLPIDMKEPLGPKIFIWGEPVLRRYLTVYDWAQKQVGFALARQPDEAPKDVKKSSIGAPEEGSLLAGAPIHRRPSASANATASVNESASSSSNRTGYSVIGHDGEVSPTGAKVNDQSSSGSSREYQVTV